MDKEPGEASSQLTVRGGKSRRRFHVRERCIGCAFCAESAPAHFRIDAEEQRSRLIHQPETMDEIRLCARIGRMCPADAIGR